MAVFTAVSDFVVDQLLTYQDVNEIKENTIYNKDQFDIDHTAASGRHQAAISLGEDTAVDVSIIAQTDDGTKPTITYAVTENTWAFRIGGANAIITDGTYTSIGNTALSTSIGLFVNGSLTGIQGAKFIHTVTADAATNSVYGVWITPSLTTNSGAGAAGLYASLFVSEPDITVDTSTVIRAATLYISGAPTEATTVNYTFWATEGNFRVESDTTHFVGFGGTTDPNLDNVTYFYIQGAYSSTGTSQSSSFRVNQALSVQAAPTVTTQCWFQGAIGTHTSGSHTTCSTVRIDEPNITVNGTATVGSAISLHVSGTPSEGAQNYGILVQNTSDAWGVFIQGNATQTKSLLLVEDSAGTNMLDVTASGVNMSRDLFINGTVDEVQLLIDGHSTQTNAILAVRTSVGAILLSTNTTKTTVNQPLLVDGTTNAVQLHIQAHSTQTNDYILMEDSSGGDVYRFGYTGQLKFQHAAAAATEKEVINAAAFDNGTDAGNRIAMYNNNNGATPASGHIMLVDKGGTGWRIWPEDNATGDMRIHTADPTNANDAAGALIGLQGSYEWNEDGTPHKIIFPDMISETEALDLVINTNYYHFMYAQGARNYTKFYGPVAEESPWLMQDRNRSFNSMNATTLNALSIRALLKRIEELENQVENLKLN